MNNAAKTRAIAGLAVLVAGVILIGTTGATFACGWALWAVGLAVLLTTVPSAGEARPPRGGKKSARRASRSSARPGGRIATRRAAGAPRPSPGPSGPVLS
jgi:hypothetical protein